MLFVLSNYKTSYEEVDISNHILNVESKLSHNQEIIVFNSKNPFSFNDLLFRYKYTQKYSTKTHSKSLTKYTQKHSQNIIQKDASKTITKTLSK